MHGMQVTEPLLTPKSNILNEENTFKVKINMNEGNQKVFKICCAFIHLLCSKMHSEMLDLSV